MAKASSWIQHVEAFVDSSRPSEQQSAGLNAIAELVKSDRLTIEGLVRELDLYLTTTDNIVRARGILLLAEILAKVMPKPLNHATICSLIGFFTSRLADWQALHGALVGCLALLRRKSEAGRVMGDEARILAQSFLQNIHVQSLALHDRKLCFELLQCLLDTYPKDVSILGEDIVHGIYEAVDGEKDPRCLMHTFQLVETLARLFPDPSGPFSSYARELFEVLGCYFPIYFTHPKSDDPDIQREDLSKALMHVFCSTTFFEQFSIPLLLEKLSSSLLLAKLDSLKYLGSCIVCYGAHRMSKHSKALWLSLKDIVFNYPQEPFEQFLSVSESVGESKSQTHQIGIEALNCLQTAIVQLNNINGDTFASLIIEDEDVEMAFSSVTCVTSLEDISVENWQKISAVRSVLRELVKVSNFCCDRVIKRFLPRLMGALGMTLDGSSSFSDTALDRRVNFGALYVSVELISACRDLAIATQDHIEVISTHNEWCSVLQNFSTPFAHTLSCLVKYSSSAGVNGRIAVRDLAYTVRGLQILATFPDYSLQLSKAVYEDILMIFMVVVAGKFEDAPLWKLALEALCHIGLFIEKYHVSEKRTSYMNIVVEKILSFLQPGVSTMPLSLKLEAFYSVGTTAVDFMLRAILEVEKAIFCGLLEFFVDGETNVRKTLIQLLDFYSSQVLPWCLTAGHFEEIGMRFIMYIWNQMEIDTDYKIDFKEKGIQNSLMMTVKLIVTSCRIEHQIMIVEKAHSIFLSKKFFPLKELKSSHMKVEGLNIALDVANLSSKEEAFISLFVSILMALSPEIPIPDTRLTIKILMLCLLKGYVPAAQALGSIINKWSLHTAAKPTTYTLEEALESIFEEVLSEVLDGSSSMDINLPSSTDTSPNDRQIIIHALVGVAWIGKGLLMRGHEKVEKAMMLLSKCLLSVDTLETMPFGENVLGNGIEEDRYLPVARCAADAFHVLLSDSEDCLNKKFHATIRPLYKQRFFSSVIPSILSSIKNCKSSMTRSSLYLAFAHIIANTPIAAVLMEANKVLPFLLDAFSILSCDSRNKNLIYCLLLVLSGIVMDEDGREIIIENVHTVINHLIGLIPYPHMMLVRETAIQCLLALSKFPYARIYPLRPQVLRAVCRALDDPKRPVRLEVVRCRQAWSERRQLHQEVFTIEDSNTAGSMTHSLFRLVCFLEAQVLQESGASLLGSAICFVHGTCSSIENACSSRHPEEWRRHHQRKESKDFRLSFKFASLFEARSDDL